MCVNFKYKNTIPTNDMFNAVCIECNKTEKAQQYALPHCFWEEKNAATTTCALYQVCLCNVQKRASNWKIQKFSNFWWGFDAFIGDAQTSKVRLGRRKKNEKRALVLMLMHKFWYKKEKKKQNKTDPPIRQSFERYGTCLYDMCMATVHVTYTP